MLGFDRGQRPARSRSPPATCARRSDGTFIGHFYAGYFQAINVVGMLLQLFVVSRVINVLWGCPWRCAILPLVALACYGSIAMAPFLAVLRWVKTAEQRDRLLAAEHGEPGPLPADDPRRQVQGQAGHRHLLRPRRAIVLSGRHGPGGLGRCSRFGPAGFALINAVLVLVWLAHRGRGRAASSRAAYQGHSSFPRRTDPHRHRHSHASSTWRLLHPSAPQPFMPLGCTPSTM